MSFLHYVMIVLFSFGATSAYGNYKYRAGDCITPTNESWSWYKHIARVEGVFKRLDEPPYDAESYLLVFVRNKYQQERRYIRPGMFSVYWIDTNTQLLPDYMCSPD